METPKQRMMSQNTPTISVIIPTHNRQASLKRLIDTLQGQAYPVEQMEVIVVADGCSDGTVEMLQSYSPAVPMRFIGQPGQGAAVARNQGAAAAKGRLLLFLDDDVEASPCLVGAHVHAHHQPNRVVIGYLSSLLKNQSGFFQIKLRAWWEEKFHMMRRPGHRSTYEDLFSGNFSVAAELFKRSGGFDPTFRYREDYELGVRLIQAGGNFTLAMDALAHHRDEVTDLDRSLLRKRHEGQADVLFGRRHPQIMHKLRLFSLGDRAPQSIRLSIFLTFKAPGISDFLVGALRRLLDVLEILRIHGQWQKLNNTLHGYWYRRGVIDDLKTHKALINYLQGAVIPLDESMNEIEVDLQQGLAVAEQQLDEKRPVSVRIRYGAQPLGRIPPQAGAEPLRGIHLRSALSTTFAWPLLQALTLEGAINPAIFSKPLFVK
jgi:glycosyltransferase involved in cell wall biosynthesis